MTIPSRIIEETERRYGERRPVREANEALIKSGDILAANTPRQVELWMNRQVRLAAQPALREAIPAARASGGPDMLPDFALERVLGKNDLLALRYLEIALRVSQAVGLVRIRAASGASIGSGTGSLVSPRLLLTNNHVLGDSRVAGASVVEFNFQEDLAGGLRQVVAFGLAPATFFVTDRQLDYTLVAVNPRGTDGSPLEAFGWNRLIEEEGKTLVGACLNIIQHPNGEPKQIALRENQLTDLLDNFLQYKTDTAPGSSGSPVFNDRWEIVGLHHSGVPQRDAQGRILSLNGVPWTEEMGEHRIAWIANEGVRISRILKHLKGQQLNGEARRLRDDLFNLAPPAILVPPREGSLVLPNGGGTTPPAPRTGNGTTLSREEGRVTWTIPLQVSVQLGTPIMDGGSAASAAIESPHITPPQPDPGPGDLPAGDPEVREALTELERARAGTYYDAAADAVDRDAYYQGVGGPGTPAAFYRALSDLVTRTHTTKLAYKPGKHVYPVVDLHPNGMLQSIYSGREFAPEAFILEDFGIERRAAELRERILSESTIGWAQAAEALDALEAASPFNCEHVVPQSWFDKREPMKGDLHHLFACESGCNSFRGNIPYFDFPDFEEVVRDACGKRDGNRFEPSAGKGPVARATLYFLLRYPGEIDPTAKEYTHDRLAILLAWHATHPVDDYERHRNAAIFKKQGNRNPLIDHPEWATRIDFNLGLQ